MNKIVEEIKKAGVFYIATVDADGQPRVRPFGAVAEFEGKVYICTNNTKACYAQMLANPKTEISGMVADGTWIRVMSVLAMAYRNILLVILINGTVFLLSILLCLFSRKTGVQAKSAFARFSRKIWLEFKLLLMGVLLILHYYSNFWVYVSVDQYSEYLEDLCLFFFTGVFLYLFVTDLCGNGTRIFDRFLPVAIYHSVQEWILASHWYRKAMHMRTAFLAAALLSFSTGGFILIETLSDVTAYYKRHHILLSPDWIILVFAALLFLAGIWLLFMYIRVRRFVRHTGLIAKKLFDMQQGIVDKSLALPQSSLLYEMAQNTNRLADGIENAVEQKNRSNKLRVELLTNVSHDLKTPLTSIINYADLLCEEELSDTASEYAHALQTKAYRLKDMVQDVFDLSKATSGNLPIERHTLDLAKLIRQTLADMDERIQASGLTFKTFFFTEAVYIEADGDKLYRVFQNLFVNALQYSLAQSRVHIQLSVENGYACAKVKNTSRDELSFDTKDILERFVRADTSRTTEGSGLGLSIAQSFTEACGGSFTVETDADMFTALLRFPLAQPPETTQAPSE